MNEIINEQINNIISGLLVLFAIGYAVFSWFDYKMHEAEDFVHAAERDTDPQPYTPDPEHIKRVLAEYGLRKALPVYAKRDPGTSEAEARDLADLKRGTSEKLCRLLP